ncbi:uncharacterized protein LOC144922376 [Branchiostoma floridae x Branchiostoma belcheri]
MKSSKQIMEICISIKLTHELQTQDDETHSQSAESQTDLGPDVSPGGPLQPTAAGLQQQLAGLSLTSSSISSTLNATPTVTAQNTAGREEDEFDMFPQTRGKSMEESRRGGSTYEDISHSGDLKSRGLAGAVNTKSKPNQHDMKRDRKETRKETRKRMKAWKKRRRLHRLKWMIESGYLLKRQEIDLIKSLVAKHDCYKAHRSEPYFNCLRKAILKEDLVLYSSVRCRKPS